VVHQRVEEAQQGRTPFGGSGGDGLAVGGDEWEYVRHEDALLVDVPLEEGDEARWRGKREDGAQQELKILLVMRIEMEMM